MECPISALIDGLTRDVMQSRSSLPSQAGPGSAHNRTAAAALSGSQDQFKLSRQGPFEIWHDVPLVP